MRTYLKSLDIKWRKVGCVSAKVNIHAQQKFHDEQLIPKLEEARTGKRAVYFVDAAHFFMGAFLGFLWCLSRIFVRTPSGRQRFNVLGALNAVTKQLEIITNDSYITSIQVCELLKALAKNTTLPITIVLDNARYQRCRLVMELAQKLINQRYMELTPEPEITILIDFRSVKIQTNSVTACANASHWVDNKKIYTASNLQLILESSPKGIYL